MKIPLREIKRAVSPRWRINPLAVPKSRKIIKPAEEDSSIYQCSCGKRFQKITQMENKKMSYIDICNGMRLEGDEHKLHIYLQYDCYRLLELLLSDYEAVAYREKGLKDIENMLQFQN